MIAPLVVVCGPPGAGKTTLAERLAPELGLVLLSKDGIKESLFDTLGVQDRDWSRRLGAASFVLAFSLAARVLEAGTGVLLEGNLRPASAAPVRALCGRSRAVIVHCDADPAVLRARYADRGAARHAGHADAAIADEMLAERAAGAFEPPDIGVPVLRVRTDGGYDPDLRRVLALVRDALAPL